MLVKDLMTPASKTVAVTPEDSITKVADLLHQNHITGLPVVNSEGVVLGTISEKDFITSGSDLYLPTYIKLLSGMDYVQGADKNLPYVVSQIVNTKAKELMNQRVPFVRPDATLEQLATLFSEKRVNPIPVTDESNKLLGIISRSDLIKFFSPSQVKKSYTSEISESLKKENRNIDNQVAYTQKYFNSRFAYVAKARANIWLTTAVVLFILGFVVGIIYVVDPSIIFNKI